MRKVALFGGSFNPPHNGHLKIVAKLAELCDYTKIFIIPTYIPPHKQIAGNIIAEHRLNMLKLIFSDFAGIEISDIEIVEKKVSYTYYTLLKLKEKFPDCGIDIIIGADNFEILDTWHKIDEILKIAKFVVFNRNFENINLRGVSAPKNFFENPQNFSFIDEFDKTETSSTIRKLFADKKKSEAEKYLPKQIFEYIDANKLYE